MKKAIYSVLIILVSIIVIFLGLKMFTGNSITVETTKVTERNLVDTITTTGKLEPNKQAKLGQSGEVSDVYVSVGDKVTAGQNLATYSDGSHLTAEFAGVVTQVNISKGDYDINTQQGKYSIVVDDLSKLKVKVNLSKNEAKKVKINQTAKVTSGKTTINGKVTEKSPTADGTNSDNPTLDALITLDEEPKDWFSGFDVDTVITIKEEPNAVTIPINAILYDENNNAIAFKVQNNTIKKVKVKTGVQSGKYVQITEGLNKNDEVVVNPDDTLKDNTSVKVGN